MATRIRLQRHGRKNYAFYAIVIAHADAPRDGRFVEKIGTYNPNTNPATVDLNFDRALYWVMTGAQPTDTTRNLLSDKGVYLKKHLLGGVKKGAFNEAEADKKFQTWLNEKEKKNNAVVTEQNSKKIASAKKRLEEEQAINKAKSEALSKKRTEAAAALEAAAKAAAEEAAAATAEAEAPAAEAPATEEKAAE